MQVLKFKPAFSDDGFDLFHVVVAAHQPLVHPITAAPLTLALCVITSNLSGTHKRHQASIACALIACALTWVISVVLRPPEAANCNGTKLSLD